MDAKNSPQMSQREEAQKQLAAAITERYSTWNAPYGVLPGLRRLSGGGAVRTVNFGVARLLDATAFIWSPDKITVEGQGALAYRVEGDYTSVAELVAKLDEALPTP